jgi:hypothetical protein
LALGDRTAQEKDDFAVSAALRALVVIAKPPVELRRIVVPLLDADLDDGRSAWRGRNQRLGRPHHRGADTETLKRWKNAEGPEMDDPFLRLTTEVEAEPSDRLPVRERQKEDDFVAVFGHCLSHVIRLDRLFAVPLKTIEIPVAERPNFERE